YLPVQALRHLLGREMGQGGGQPFRAVVAADHDTDPDGSLRAASLLHARTSSHAVIDPAAVHAELTCSAAPSYRADRSGEPDPGVGFQGVFCTWRMRCAYTVRQRSSSVRRPLKCSTSSSIESPSAG